jgi:hypothetical protein
LIYVGFGIKGWTLAYSPRISLAVETYERVNPSDCTWRSGEIYLAVLFYKSLAVVSKGDDGAEWSGFINQFSITQFSRHS